MNWNDQKGGGSTIDLPTFKLPPGWWKIALFVLGGIVALSIFRGGFYTVESEEEAVVLRFGRFIGVESSGLHLKIPFGVDEIIKLPTKRILKEEFGFVTEKAGVRSTFRSAANQEESIIMTGDLNVADVEWVIQYRIGDPKAYLFNVREVDHLIRDMAQSVMRSIIGDKTVHEVLTVGRKKIEIEAFEMLQKILDQFHTGVTLTLLKLQNVNPPEEVKSSFNEVNKAKQDKEYQINQANKEYNKIIPKAKGEAERRVETAEGYRLDRINKAKGDATKFTTIWEEYRHAKEVTKRRMYIETISALLPKIDKIYVIDKDQRTILPHLDLGAGKIQGATTGGAK